MTISKTVAFRPYVQQLSQYSFLRLQVTDMTRHSLIHAYMTSPQLQPSRIGFSMVLNILPITIGKSIGFSVQVNVAWTTTYGLIIALKLR